MAAITEMGRADQLASHAAAELYEQHSSRIFGYCLARLGRREDAEDATQLTFLHVVRGLGKGVVPAAESAWLFGIARNVCLSRWASAGRRSRVEAACDPTELERVAAAHDSHREELIGLERALELLPEQQRRAVLLRDWRGLSYEEVAETLGVSHAAVETLIFRGRAALAEQLEEQPSEPRRRLRSLGELGSLLHAIKGAFTGAATAGKLATGVAAVVAVSGSGMVLRVSASDPAPARPAALQPAPDVATTATPASQRAKTSSAPARVIAADHAVSAQGPAPSTAIQASPVRTDGPAASAPAAAPAVERTPELDTAAVAAPAASVATRQVETPAGAVPAASETPAPETPAVKSPVLSPLELPSTEPVTAATDPVVAVVEETLSAAPPLPSLPPQLPPPTVALPPLPPVPGSGPLLP